MAYPATGHHHFNFFPAVQVEGDMDVVGDDTQAGQPG